MGVISSLPFYITYWPIFILSQCIIMTGAALSVVLMSGVEETSRTSGPRYQLLKATIKVISRCLIYAFGYFWVEIEQDHTVCYK